MLQSPFSSFLFLKAFLNLVNNEVQNEEVVMVHFYCLLGPPFFDSASRAFASINRGYFFPRCVPRESFGHEVKLH